LLDLPALDGSVPRSVAYDEMGAYVHADAMTGTTATGGVGATCSAWTSSTGSPETGVSSFAGSLLYSFTKGSCLEHVYCAEVGRDVPVSLVYDPFPMGRYLFATGSTIVCAQL
jgi:hypothetical protein